MKSLKPLLFVVAGMAIAFLFAFKSEEPKKEYCLIRVSAAYKSEVLIIYNGDSKEYPIGKTGEALTKESVKIINEQLATGWRLISTDVILEGSSGNSSYSHKYNTYLYHLERTKQ
jgi:hypothetical protein